MRKALMAVLPVLMLAALVAGPVAARSPGPTVASLHLQERPALEDPASFDGFDFAVHDVAAGPASALPGVTEVRIAVSLRNTGTRDLEFSPTFRSARYPAVQLRDGAGNAHGVDTLHPGDSSIARSVLRSIPPGLTARWTLGFQVPTADFPGSSIETVRDGVVVATWDLDAAAAAPLAWDAPVYSAVGLGTSIDWSDELRVVPGRVGSVVCGDPAIEPVTQIVALTFTVTNSTGASVQWPGNVEPADPAIARWADGTSARFSVETFVGEEETLIRRSGSAVLIPPGETAERAFVFAVPRDGRVGEVDTLPDGVLLTPPGQAAPLWLDLAGATSSVGIAASFCDLGLLSGPIPYSYSPPPRFTELAEAAEDPGYDAARARLLNALVAGGQYLDGGGVLAELDAEALAELAPGPLISLVDVTAAFEIDEREVGFDIVVEEPPGEPDIAWLLVLTQADDGRWFCAASPFDGVTLNVSNKRYFENALLECLPFLEGDTAEGDGTGDGGDGSGDGTGDGS